MLKTISALKSEGWEALVKNLGIVEATRYILQFQTGSGDYTKTRHTIFKDIPVEEIIKDIKDKYPKL
jgi:hypothetical protein